ncbi:MAG: hypothetical protein Harvfovirus2_29 [Harvfovirus sp.]|uniref:Apple domain-containing protein n=1 Tax=Harvfovirus sp. TaxID=2487768 RepID=A0A3G5A4V0_9VIRU|nr:MAG: hypothetical protein Harvfovirus2_29 [Harvfovirus sp.]
MILSSIVSFIILVILIVVCLFLICRNKWFGFCAGEQKIQCNELINSPSYKPRVNSTLADTAAVSSTIVNVILNLVNLAIKLAVNETFYVSDGLPASTINNIIIDEKYTMQLGTINLYNITGVGDSLNFNNIYQIQDHNYSSTDPLHVMTGITTFDTDLVLHIIPPTIAPFIVNFSVCGEVLLTLNYRCDKTRKDPITSIQSLVLSNFKILGISYDIPDKTIATIVGIAKEIVSINKILIDKLTVIMNSSPNVLEKINRLIGKQLPINFPNILGCLELPMPVIGDYVGLRDYAAPNSSNLASAVKQNISLTDCEKTCRESNCKQFDYLGSNEIGYCFTYDNYIEPKPNADYYSYRKMKQ